MGNNPMVEIKKGDIIDQTIAYVKQDLSNESSGHDWWHIYRVWNMSKRIQAEYCNIDTLVVELTALLHDIADWKSNNQDFKLGSTIAKKWLSDFDQVSSEQIDHICHNIENISFKGITDTPCQLSIEGQIVQDADRLDAMGAIGIARTFTFGGFHGRLIYEPDNSEDLVYNNISYFESQSNSTSINHFYKKLLLIKDLMNTKYGKKLAIKRHHFMKNFLSQFYTECDGTS